MIDATIVRAHQHSAAREKNDRSDRRSRVTDHQITRSVDALAIRRVDATPAKLMILLAPSR